MYYMLHYTLQIIPFIPEIWYANIRLAAEFVGKRIKVIIVESTFIKIERIQLKFSKTNDKYSNGCKNMAPFSLGYYKGTG